jgi:hypothetical protein
MNESNWTTGALLRRIVAFEMSKRIKDGAKMVARRVDT